MRHFQELGLMSHNLRIETGRWSRTPSQDRVCICDNARIQTEQHVLVECPLTEHLRDKYSVLNYRNVNELLNDNVHLRDLCSFVYDVLDIFE